MTVKIPIFVQQGGPDQIRIQVGELGADAVFFVRGQAQPEQGTVSGQHQSGERQIIQQRRPGGELKTKPQDQTQRSAQHCHTAQDAEQDTECGLQG